MLERQYRSGEVIFSQGDPSEYVVQILSGAVEIVKEVDGKPIVLGVAEKGEFIGEMGIFEGAPRNATARAKGQLTALLASESEFMKMVGETPKLAEHLLGRLSARLRVTSRELAEARILVGEAKADRFLDFCDMDSGLEIGVPEINRDEPRLVLMPYSSFLAEQIPDIGISIDEFPFVIGRKSDEFSANTPGTIIVHLPLDDFQPYRLSRVHFMIHHPGDYFIVRDMGSALGTSVNGHSIGIDFPRDSVELEPGENIIVAGGAESPFSFSLNIPGH